MAINIQMLLSEALLALCDEKKLTSITIKNLLDKTGVSRQTFYNYFIDKNDLIQWTYEHKVLNIFLATDTERTYYENTLTYYKNIDAHRTFLKQACSIREQNCLTDYIINFAIDYDLKWHQQHCGNKVLSDELIFASKYHSIAAIYAAIEWINSDTPQPAEIMAKRITKLRKLSLSDVLFDSDIELYNCD